MTQKLKITLAKGTRDAGQEMVAEQLQTLSGVFTVMSCYRGEEENPDIPKELFVNYDGAISTMQNICDILLVKNVTPL